MLECFCGPCFKPIKSKPVKKDWKFESLIEFIWVKYLIYKFGVVSLSVITTWGNNGVRSWKLCIFFGYPIQVETPHTKSYYGCRIYYLLIRKLFLIVNYWSRSPLVPEFIMAYHLRNLDIVYQNFSFCGDKRN